MGIFEAQVTTLVPFRILGGSFVLFHLITPSVVLWEVNSCPRYQIFWRNFLLTEKTNIPQTKELVGCDIYVHLFNILSVRADELRVRPPKKWSSTLLLWKLGQRNILDSHIWAEAVIFCLISTQHVIASYDTAEAFKNWLFKEDNMGDLLMGRGS